VPALEWYRRRLALSQEDLAHLAHVGKSTVGRGESGKPIRPSSVRKLAKALKISAWDLQQPAPSV